MDALRQIRDRTIEPSLRNARGEPNFNVKFYVLNAAGDYAGVAMYGGDQVRFAVCTEEGARLEPCDALLDGDMAMKCRCGCRGSVQRGPFRPARSLELAIDERRQLLDRSVLERRAVGVAVADDEAGDGVAARGVVEQHDALAGGPRPPQHVADLEPHAVARSRGFGDERVAARQPVDVPAVDVFLAQARLGLVHVVVEQVRRQHVVPVRCRRAAIARPAATPPRSPRTVQAR